MRAGRLQPKEFRVRTAGVRPSSWNPRSSGSRVLGSRSEPKAYEIVRQVSSYATAKMSLANRRNPMRRGNGHFFGQEEVFSIRCSPKELEQRRIVGGFFKCLQIATHVLFLNIVATPARMFVWYFYLNVICVAGSTNIDLYSRGISESRKRRQSRTGAVTSQRSGPEPAASPRTQRPTARPHGQLCGETHQGQGTRAGRLQHGFPGLPPLPRPARLNGRPFRRSRRQQ